MDEKAVEHLLRTELGARSLEVVVSLPGANAVPRVVEGIKRAAMRHPGPLPVHLRVHNGSQTMTLELPVTVSNSIRADLRRMFGPHACDET